MPLTPSRIDTVKVYHSGATVVRELVVEATGGRLPDEIEIADLPLALMDASVRLRVKSVDDPAAELVAADLRIGLYVPRREPPKDAPDVAELKAIEEKILTRRDLLGLIQAESALLDRLEIPDRPTPEEGRPPPASPMAARVAMEDFLEEATARRIEEARAIALELERLEEEAASLRDRIDRASNAEQVKAEELTKIVVARLRQGPGAIKRATMVLEYFVPGARWASAYQVRLERDGRSAQIQLRALVCQRSGEDWRGVRLELSTASPMRWGDLPELTEIRIGRVQPSPPEKRGFRPPPVGADRLFQDHDRDRIIAQGCVPSHHGWMPPSLSLAPLASFAGGELMSRPVTLGGASFGGPAGGAAFADLSAPEEATGEVAIAAMRAMDLGDEEAAPSDVDALESRAMRAAPRAPAPPPAAKPMMAPSRARLKKAEKAVLREEMEQEEGGQLVADESVREALVFTQLELPGPDQGGRNKLRPLDLETQYLALLRRNAPRAGREALEMVRAAQRRAQEAGRQPLPRDTADVRATSGYFDFVYFADSVVDIPSDGTFHSIALGSRTAKCELQYVVVPRLEPNVYRTALIENPTEAPLLPGPTEVYVAGEYVLTTSLPTVPPRGQLTLGLGVEQAIKCARNTRFIEKRSGTKVVATNDLWHEIDIELVNHLDREARCEVRERIPQPEEGAEVVVEEGEVRPPWEPYLQDERGAPLRGGRRWNVTVPPSGTIQLAAKYAVKIYANNEVVGGNRREV